ncbi:MAG: Flp pilus assembly complex ATPase component TadA [Deltaproteobacteria bacterium]|nr:Flp pilus assembly complex ATPase component TadA [Deltaproteobacteria bacterium]
MRTARKGFEPETGKKKKRHPSALTRKAASDSRAKKKQDKSIDFPHRLKIGEIFVREGLLTPEELKEACQVQKSQTAYQPLGEICVKMNFFSRHDLTRVLRKYKKRIPLGVLLVNLSLITRDQLVAALKRGKLERKKLGEVLISEGHIAETTLINSLSIQLGVPKIVPNIQFIDKDLLQAVKPGFLQSRQLVPAFKKGDTVVVIMANPLDENTIRELERIYGKKVEPAIASPMEIRHGLNQLLGFQANSGSAGKNWKDLIIGEKNVSEEEQDTAVEIVNYLITNAILEKASDIHIEPMENRLRIRYRLDGVLHHKTDLPAFMTPSIISRIKALCGMDIAERRRHQDGRLLTRFYNRDVDLRISSYASVYGENVVIRILDKRVTQVELDQVGFSPTNDAWFKGLLEYPSGVILVTGPTGCGKTTTLYAALNHLNDANKSIITVEDPVEYSIEGLVQAQLNPRIGLTYTDYLRSMMRQDPDVIMVGEIRDKTAAEAVIQSALTGHKVLSSFHTDDTTGALLRLMDMGINTFLISSTVVSVLAQRLVRTLCPFCKEPHVPDQGTLTAYHLLDLNPANHQFYKPKGCLHCNNTGFKGRTSIHELLIVNDKIRDAILARQTSTRIRTIARQTAKLISLLEDGFYKATKGMTSLEEVLRVAPHNESDVETRRSAEEILALCEGKEPRKSSKAALTEASGSQPHQETVRLIPPKTLVLPSLGDMTPSHMQGKNGARIHFAELKKKTAGSRMNNVDFLIKRKPHRQRNPLLEFLEHEEQLQLYGS